MHFSRVATALAIALTVSSPAWPRNVQMDALFSDRWQGDLATDHMTDEKVLFVSIATTNVNRRIGFDLARVYLECRSGKARMVIEWDFKAAGSANLVAQYRFAGKPGR